MIAEAREDVTNRPALPQGAFPLRLVSDGEHFSVHTYFDVCPESPDGRRVAYTRFDRPPGRGRKDPEPGSVIVQDLASRDEWIVGRFRARAGHTGAFAVWLDEATLAYQDGEDVQFVDVCIGRERVYRGACQMYDPRLGAAFVGHEAGLPEGLYAMDPQTGRTRAVLLLDSLRATKWLRDERGLGPWAMHHAKWSPGGTRAAVRVGAVDAAGRKVQHLFTCRPDGSDLVHFEYLRDGRSHKPLHFNFYDEASFYGYDVAAPERPCRRWSLDGTPIETLHQGDGNHACASPGGSYLVTDSRYGRDPARILFYRKGTTEPVVLAEMPLDARTDPHPSLSRDGRRVYFNACGGVYTVDIGGLL